MSPLKRAVGEPGRLGSRVGRLSTGTLWLLDGFSAWFAQCYRGLHPELEWELDTMKQIVTYHRPMLGTVAPPHPAQALVHAALKVPPDTEWLGRIWDFHVEHLARRRDAPREGHDQLLDETSVGRIGSAASSDWDVEIWISEIAEFEIGAEAFEDLDDRIRAMPGVRELVWQDGEIMLARIERGVAPEALEARIRAMLAELRKEEAAREAAEHGEEPRS